MCSYELLHKLTHKLSLQHSKASPVCLSKLFKIMPTNSKNSPRLLNHYVRLVIGTTSLLNTNFFLNQFCLIVTKELLKNNLELKVYLDSGFQKFSPWSVSSIALGTSNTEQIITGKLLHTLSIHWTSCGKVQKKKIKDLDKLKKAGTENLGWR